MTIEELLNHFNTNHGIVANWPESYEVDHETFANICDFYFHHEIDGFIKIFIGKNNGIMFKNVELILKKNK